MARTYIGGRGEDQRPVIATVDPHLRRVGGAGHAVEMRVLRNDADGGQEFIGKGVGFGGQDRARMRASPSLYLFFLSFYSANFVPVWLIASPCIGRHLDHNRL